MVSINTNLSSLIVQNNLSKSTNALNTAIERMTTGFKINHASDNAAGYSIAQDMDSKISSYGVAQDNISAGMDLVATAMDTISLMQSHGERIMALWTQAQNGTYGNQSLQAIQSEVNARMAEITRLYKTTEFNDTQLFDKKAYDVADYLPQAGESGFIDESEEAEIGTIGTSGTVGTIGTVGLTEDLSSQYKGFISNPTAVDGEDNAIDVDSLKRTSEIDVSTVDGLAEYNSTTQFQIRDRADLEKLANLVNSGTNTTGKTFYLSADIDLGAVAEDVTNWTPIGDYATDTSYVFKGTFDGNGHKITNLSINNASTDYQGLFGTAAKGSVIKNVGVEGRVKGNNYSGGIIGYLGSAETKVSIIENCYSNVYVQGNGDCTGGLVGYTGNYCTTSNSYATGTVTGNGKYTGGLVGAAKKYNSISNSYATGTVTGEGNNNGGLIGYIDENGSISNSYATGLVTGEGSNTGGLIGYTKENNTINNSYATGAVTGTGDYTGGLVGVSSGEVTNCYAVGNVTGEGYYTGGLVGISSGEVTNCYAKGDVTGKSGDTGGLIGYTNENSTISNSYAAGAVTGKFYTGGLIGNANAAIYNSYATGSVNGTGSYIGGLIGDIKSNCEINNCYATGAVTGTGDKVGGLAGRSSIINNSYATGSVSSIGDDKRHAGGLVGYASGRINNSYATGSVSATGENRGYTGGLAGYAGQINNSYATGSVSVISESAYYVGGLAGIALWSVSNSYATGSVSAIGEYSEYTGGLIAYARREVSNCYATGNVSGAAYVGGLIGVYEGGNVEKSYSAGNVKGEEFVGGLVGILEKMDSVTVTIKDSSSYSTIDSGDKTGSFIGGYVGMYKGYTYTLTLDNCTSALLDGQEMIGGYYRYNEPIYTKDETYDMTSLLENISEYHLKPTATTLQVGINGDNSCQISFDTNFELGLDISDITSLKAYNSIKTFLDKLSEKSTQLGAVTNRLDSALESTSTAIENLTSSRSTIKDADIATESSQYIKAQILQQAAATLLATANQSPSIALQLI